MNERNTMRLEACDCVVFYSMEASSRRVYMCRDTKRQINTSESERLDTIPEKKGWRGFFPVNTCVIRDVGLRNESSLCNELPDAAGCLKLHSELHVKFHDELSAWSFTVIDSERTLSDIERRLGHVRPSIISESIHELNDSNTENHDATFPSPIQFQEHRTINCAHYMNDVIWTWKSICALGWY